jgi:hypothetical protein
MNENVAYMKVLNYTAVMETLENVCLKLGAIGETKPGRHCSYWRHVGA